MNRTIVFLLILLSMTACFVPNTYQVFKPRGISYYKKNDSVFYKNAGRKERFINVFEDGKAGYPGLNFYPQNFIDVGAISYFYKHPDQLAIDSALNQFKSWDNASYPYGWGFYKISNDSLFIEYFQEHEGVAPSNKWLSRLYGRILSDSIIVIEKEIFREPTFFYIGSKTDTTVFDPPFLFKKYQVQYKPDYKKSWIYKSCWYKRYLKKAGKNKSIKGNS